MSEVIVDSAANQDGLTRRHFLRNILTVGAAAVLVGSDVFNPSVAAAQEAEDVGTQKVAEATDVQDDLAVEDVSHDTTHKPNPIREFPAWYEAFTDTDQSIGTSAVQNLMASFGGVAVSAPLMAAGVPIGNNGLEEIINNPERLLSINPGGLLRSLVVVAPVAEELVFRAAPSMALNVINRNAQNWSNNSGQLGAALVTSSIFAAAHNKGVEHKSVPVPQFVSGMALWRIHRSRGVMHAMAAHAANNAIAAGIIIPRVHREQQELISSQNPPRQVVQNRVVLNQPKLVERPVLVRPPEQIKPNKPETETEKMFRDIFGAE